MLNGTQLSLQLHLSIHTFVCKKRTFTDVMDMISQAYAPFLRCRYVFSNSPRVYALQRCLCSVNAEQREVGNWKPELCLLISDGYAGLVILYGVNAAANAGMNGECCSIL